ARSRIASFTRQPESARDRLTTVVPMQKDRRPAPSISPTTQAGSPRPILSAKTLSAALTPRGLFTNLFVFHFASTSVGSVKQSTKVKKEDVADRKRPSFYQADDVLYAYGSGLE